MRIVLAGQNEIRLSHASFDQLAAGGGGPAVIAELWAAESRRRLVMLRAFLDAAAADPESAGPLPPIEEAFSALERAEHRAPDAMGEILMHPQVGAWLAYVLRRHGGGTASTAPSWVDFGQLHAVAAVASAAAGLDYRAAVPLRRGRVMLPRRGMARFDGCPQWDTAEVATADGQVWLSRGDVRIDVPPDGSEGPGWWPLRSASVGEDLRLVVWLDDLDPMRDLADPVDPVRLSRDDVERWTSLLDEAWAILVERHRPVAEAIAAGVTSLVPLPVGEGWDTRSASSGDAFGAIMCSLPPEAVTMAVSLVHESMHIKLGGLMHVEVLTRGPGKSCLYAPWRDDPRPADGLLQGIYAFSGIAAFWRVERLATGELDGLGDFEFAYARAQAREALGIASVDGELTEIGHRFTARLADEMDSWPDDRRDPKARALVGLVADGHRAGWRIRHNRPRARDVAALVREWRAGGADPVLVTQLEVVADGETRHWSGARLGLARRRLAELDHYVDVRDKPWGAGLTDADLSLFAGNPAAAENGFAEQIRDDPGDADAWTGLGLAMAATGHPGGSALLEFPEFLAALHLELGRPEPAELAAWAEHMIRRRP
ncbi:HEXXH motif domain-containing protein [Actinoplanes sp. NPDC051513]|uniref:HEXXH motif domain-containing protein n=1 Tax=Actinoplanes sp. NPDC051513 TaxID=3363908 RepID=UPI00378ED25A